ncbi:hypothetical protein [Zoogloea sp.]|uniref:hypothetical protein n=1 Tax=Zoogloea sp. TaxID=49181 RepID=UPI002620C77C|nr:hypothetical protein [Zoogloea sp.]MDD3354449.1 hypothetical protein [Zoogloea sp.]
MARFVGTVQEFHHFVGPRLRNVVQTATAKLRKQQGGVCQHCGQTAALESAHRHGKERRVLIENVLAKHEQDDGLIDCDLKHVEQALMEAHQPLEETFIFLCSPCHRAYDAETHKRRIRKHTQKTSEPLKVADSSSTPAGKLKRIKGWSKKHSQNPHRIIVAFLKLESEEQEVTRAALKAKANLDEFEGAYASLKTDAGNSYGDIFYEEAGLVRMHPAARAEVTKYFDEAKTS